MARQALETTLYRLRRTVDPEVVVQRDRRLSLAPKRWLQGLSSAEGSGGPRLEALCETIRAGDPAVRSTPRLRIA